LTKSLPTWPKNQKAMKKNTKIQKCGVPGVFCCWFFVVTLSRLSRLRR